jgi:hypothetical protein
MTDDHIYTERISSSKTELLFIALAILFAALSAWRAKRARVDRLARLFLFIFTLFLFYALNYRTLVIRLTPEAIKLTFGIFSWTVSLDNVADCRHDELPALMRLGGAGIHFMAIRKRYRVSFNFLEYPRVVIALRKKAGPVRDVSFTTRRPNQVVQLIQAAVAAKQVESTTSTFGG